MRTLVLAATTAVLLACRVSAFTCDRDDDCSDTPGGLCQSEGYCSFPDDSCESGQRFGEYSGTLSNDCVPVDEQDTEAPTTTPSTSEDGTTPSTTTLPMTTEPASEGTTPGLSVGSEDSTSTTDAPSTTAESSSGGSELDPSLWFTFDEKASDGIVNDGTLGGVAACSDLTCPTATEGLMESAGLFDGINDCGVIDAGDLLAVDAEFTVAAWIRVDALPPGPAVILGQPFGDGLFNTWDLAVMVMGNAVWIVYEGILDEMGNGVAAIETDLLEIGGWMHVAVTHSPDTITLWLDGDFLAQETGFLLVGDAQPLLLGCDDDHTGDYSLFFPGALDDVRLYERVLDPDEIFDLASP